jgi:hypothetical protein
MDPSKLVELVNLKPNKTIEFIVFTSSIIIYVPHFIIIFGLDKILDNFTQYILLAIFLALISLGIFISLASSVATENLTIRKDLYLQLEVNKNYTIKIREKLANTLLKFKNKNLEIKDNSSNIHNELMSINKSISDIENNYDESIAHLKKRIESDEISMDNIISNHSSWIISWSVRLHQVSAFMSFIILLSPFISVKEITSIDKFIQSNIGIITVIVSPIVFIVIFSLGLYQIFNRLDKNSKATTN